MKELKTNDARPQSTDLIKKVFVVYFGNIYYLQLVVCHITAIQIFSKREDRIHHSTEMTFGKQVFGFFQHPIPKPAGPSIKGWVN